MCESPRQIFDGGSHYVNEGDSEYYYFFLLWYSSG